jgi:hypothetical protein
LKHLGPKARNHIRRGLKEFDIRFMEHSEFLSKGAQAYCDTIRRNGFASITPEHFAIGYRVPRPWQKLVGAFKDSCLAAYLMVTEFDDWASIENYSADRFRPLGVNNALDYFTMHEYLCQERFRGVTYGLGSLQTSTKADGLHQFKLSMGFEAVPVHRRLVVNPLLRPLVNQALWGLTKEMVKLSRNHPLLRKAEGAIRMVLESNSQPSFSSAPSQEGNL